MSAITAARPAAVPPAPEAPARRFSLLKPLTWLVVMLVVAITVIPMIFVIEGGFRSTAQINAFHARFADRRQQHDHAADPRENEEVKKNLPGDVVDVDGHGGAGRELCLGGGVEDGALAG